jgi:branched-chain amino acid transport system substrate-binding protein
VPQKVAQALHQAKNWKGVSGEYTYDDKGDIPDKKIGEKIVRGGQFETVK